MPRQVIVVRLILIIACFPSEASVPSSPSAIASSDSGGQQVPLLVQLLRLPVSLDQPRQHLWAGGDPAGLVEDQTEQEEEDRHKHVAGDGHQCGGGESRHAAFRFHGGRIAAPIDLNTRIYIGSVLSFVQCQGEAVQTW